MTSTAITLLILSIAAATTGTMAAFQAKGWSAPVACIGIAAMMSIPDFNAISWPTAMFWGTASIIAWGIHILLPPQVAKSRKGVGYITIGSLAGTSVGLLASAAGMIIGSATGALCGALAYSRTPAGRTLNFPSAEFRNYFCAKGLPIIITTCIVGTIITTLYLILYIPRAI